MFKFNVECFILQLKIFKEQGGDDSKVHLTACIMELMTLDVQNIVNWQGTAKDKDSEKMSIQAFPLLLGTLILSVRRTVNGTTVTEAQKDIKYIFNHTYERIRSARGKV